MRFARQADGVVKDMHAAETTLYIFALTLFRPTLPWTNPVNWLLSLYTVRVLELWSGQVWDQYVAGSPFEPIAALVWVAWMGLVDLLAEALATSVFWLRERGRLMYRRCTRNALNWG